MVCPIFKAGVRVNRCLGMRRYRDRVVMEYGVSAWGLLANTPVHWHHEHLAGDEGYKADDL